MVLVNITGFAVLKILHNLVSLQITAEVAKSQKVSNVT